jgi:hypothetical protein
VTSDIDVVIDAVVILCDPWHTCRARCAEICGRNTGAPYLRGWESVVGHQRTGVYGNSKTIEWALHDGLGSYFWQHNWGSPDGQTHRGAHLHRVEIDKRHVGGAGVDINNICEPQFGQWARADSPVRFQQTSA